MPLFFKHTEQCLGVWKLEESPEELLALLQHKELYLPFLDRIGSESRRREWLASRVLLKELVGEEIRIAYKPNGAPYLPDSPLYISISHTKGYAAVLLQSQPAVGVDIEYRSERVRKIRSRFMTPEEECGIDKNFETAHLLIHWCAKEALFKMIGQEEVDFRRHLHIQPFPYGQTGCFSAYETRTSADASCRVGYQICYQVAPEFVLAWSL